LVLFFEKASLRTPSHLLKLDAIMGGVSFFSIKPKSTGAPRETPRYAPHLERWIDVIVLRTMPEYIGSWRSTPASLSSNALTSSSPLHALADYMTLARTLRRLKTSGLAYSRWHRRPPTRSCYLRRSGRKSALLPLLADYASTATPRYPRRSPAKRGAKIGSNRSAPAVSRSRTPSTPDHGPALAGNELRLAPQVFPPP